MIVFGLSLRTSRATPDEGVRGSIIRIGSWRGGRLVRPASVASVVQRNPGQPERLSLREYRLVVLRFSA